MNGHDDPPTVDGGRRRFLATTTAAVGAVGACCLAVPFARSLRPDAGARAAAAPVTVDIAGLKEGERLVVAWRGQPVWVLHRSRAMLERLAALDGRLLDPQSRNPEQQPGYVLAGDRGLRSIRPEISVLVGLCTHLAARRKWRPMPCRSPTIRTGRAVTSAPATSRASTCPAACSRTCRRVPTFSFRRTTMSMPTRW